MGRYVRVRDRMEAKGELDEEDTLDDDIDDDEDIEIEPPYIPDIKETRVVPVFRIKTSARSVPVWLLGDIHAFCTEFDMQEFVRYRAWAIDNKAYVIGLGDWIESCIPTHMPQTMWTQQIDPSSQTKWIGKQMAPLRLRIMGLVSGNHENRIFDVTSFNPMEILAERLGTLFLGYGGYLRVIVNDAIEYIFAIFHGASFSQNPKLELTKAYNAYPDADVFAIGHNHTLYREDYPRLRIVDNKEVVVPAVGIRTGGFLGYPSYVRKKIGSPGITGSPIVYLGAREKQITVTLGVAG